ncbi:uncharacterized protein B0H64DRAFT_385847 [Chaetomium fimeti]|uniref:Uncharacterized protein n=1 Tax=Chaetomium fimeti TaxID=1854472 RepID=A0AAE0LV55_9PEZI|nr:hypothetical protein B0H64DRAFT_385847 [Chaetomium fimeti]
MYSLPVRKDYATNLPCLSVHFITRLLCLFLSLFLSCVAVAFYSIIKTNTWMDDDLFLVGTSLSSFPLQRQKDSWFILPRLCLHDDDPSFLYPSGWLVSLADVLFPITAVVWEFFLLLWVHGIYG